jgi:hypothetical protein
MVMISTFVGLEAWNEHYTIKTPAIAAKAETAAILSAVLAFANLASSELIHFISAVRTDE